MNATGTITSTNASAAGASDRYIVNTATGACEVRARAIAPIAEVLGFEAEMDVAAGGWIDASTLLGGAADGDLIADLLDSRMIAPPRPRHRRQRSVSSRAVFYGTSGK